MRLLKIGIDVTSVGKLELSVSLLIKINKKEYFIIKSCLM